MDEVVITAGAGFAPQRPGHGVNNRRLAVAVIAGEAGEMDAGKVQRRDIVPVAHEVTQAEFDGYHLDPILAQTLLLLHDCKKIMPRLLDSIDSPADLKGLSLGVSLLQ